MRPEEKREIAALLRRIESRTAQCAVIGLGVVGRQTLSLVLEAGYPASAFDRSTEAAERARKACAGKSHGVIGTDPSVLQKAEIVLIAVRLPVREGSTDLEPLRAVATVLNAHARTCRLIVLQSTVPPGTTGRLAREWLKAADGGTNLVVYSPERLQEGNRSWTLENTPRLLAGVNDEAFKCGRVFFRTICATTVPVDSPEIAELSKLLENAYTACNISLQGEFNRLAGAHGTSGKAVANAAATKPYGYHAFWPGGGFGGHCIPNDLLILLNAMAEKQLEAPLLRSVAAVAARMPSFLVEQLRHHLGRPLAGERVLVVGVGFKPGSADTTKSPAEPVVRELLGQQAIPAYLDGLVQDFAVDGVAIRRVTDLTTLERCLAIVLSGEENLAAAPPRSFELILDACRDDVRVPPGCRLVPV